MEQRLMSSWSSSIFEMEFCMIFNLLSFLIKFFQELYLLKDYYTLFVLYWCNVFGASHLVSSLYGKTRRSFFHDLFCRTRSKLFSNLKNRTLIPTTHRSMPYTLNDFARGWHQSFLVEGRKTSAWCCKRAIPCVIISD